ncbi:EAL domain-containing protein [Zoogloea sp. LCSB751]|uniref:EAL domain-containing protein n=1 Tax=Zoogloea sp. LCSB751 TaxID=1965277 RepID=UPI0009A48A13|nr:EAL domain-containing protein [Zoogloea sp. LCSB751]
MYLSGLIVHLRELLASEALSFVFQPIFDLRRRSVLGYETLMRGPEGSPLHTPEQLLRVAREAELGLELERLATRLAVAAFVAAELPGRLFINLSTAMIADHATAGDLPELLAGAGLAPERLVIELRRQANDDDSTTLTGALHALAAQGIGMAFDHLAPDADSSAPQPDFIKLSPLQVRQIHANLPRQQEVAACLERAETLGIQLVAEGVEDARELAALNALGCAFAQGFLLGRPSTEPFRQLSRGVSGILDAQRGTRVLPATPRPPLPPLH